MILAKKPSLLPVLLLLLALITTAPYLVAWLAAGPDHVFGGFLLNPLDGNSYLAKMQQGYAGSWLFTLPFTAEPGEGAYLFVFYLALGHLARLLGWPLLLIFQLARLAGIGALVVSLYRFFHRQLGSNAFVLAIWLSALGSGLGWLAVPFGGFTADFWVAEAYPFLSAYANPHFPLSLALLLALLTPPGEGLDGEYLKEGMPALIAGAALALLSPFGVALGLGVLGLNAALAALTRREIDWTGRRLFWLGLGSGPLLAYSWWVVSRHPALAVWNAQNLTPTPPLLDLLLSFSPALILALGALFAGRPGGEAGQSPPVVMAFWALMVAVLIWFPVSLQRRLLMGFYVPLAGLAAWTVGRIKARRPRLGRGVAALMLALAIPTNLLVLAAALHGASVHDPALYLTRDEASTLSWIQENTPPAALIASAPETGLFIPAWTGRRVIYGHPFETVNAGQQREAVETFFSSAGDQRLVEAFLTSRQVDYVFWGPRERALASGPLSLEEPPIFQAGDVRLYAVAP